MLTVNPFPEGNKIAPDLQSDLEFISPHLELKIVVNNACSVYTYLTVGRFRIMITAYCFLSRN